MRVDELRPIDKAMVYHPMAHPPQIWFANDLHFGVNPVTDVQKATFKGLYGGDYQKLELFMNDAEMEQRRVKDADLDIFYWHLLNQFWAVKGGVNYFYRPTLTPYFQPGFGVEGLLPYFIETDVRSYLYAGSFKVDVELDRDIQITNNFFIGLGLRGIFATKTVEDAIIGSGLNKMQYTITPYYRLQPGLSIFAEFEHEVYYGPYKNLQINLLGSSNTDNSLSFGVEVVF